MHYLCYHSEVLKLSTPVCFSQIQEVARHLFKMAKEVLVKFNQNHKIVTVGENDNLRNVLQETFGLSKNDFINSEF